MNVKFALLAVVLGGITGKSLSQPVITAQPQDKTNMVGSSVTFSVAATGTLPITYRWAFGSPPANLDDGTNKTLLLTNLQMTNQGSYQVVVSDTQGSVTSRVAQLYVVAPPTIQFTSNSF